MATTRYVTRTLVTTDCEVSYVLPKTKKFKSIVVSVQGTYDDKKLERVIRKRFSELVPEGVFIGITSTKHFKRIYRMVEAEFMSLVSDDAVIVEEW